MNESDFLEIISGRRELETESERQMECVCVCALVYRMYDTSKDVQFYSDGAAI